MLNAVGRLLLRFFFKKVSFRVRVTGTERIPRRGSLLVVSNHISYFDAPLLGAYLRRKPYFMAMAELFRLPIFSWVISVLGGFPVDRSRGKSPIRPVRKALRYLSLKKGCCVVIFPEGGIRLDEKSVIGGASLKEGAGFLALKTGALVLPVIIQGTRELYNPRNWFRWVTISLIVGHPFHILPPAGGLTNKQQRRLATEKIRDALRLTAAL